MMSSKEKPSTNEKNNDSLAMPKPMANLVSPLIQKESSGRHLPTSTPAAKSLSPQANKLLPLYDGIGFLTSAAHAISQDEFSKCFETKHTVKPQNFVMYYLYLAGMFIRYFILFPIRLSVLMAVLSVTFSCLPIFVILKDARILRCAYKWAVKAFLFAFSARVRYHGTKPDPKEGHIFVANHTSFIDFFMMSGQGLPHATVAQIHGGLFGLLQRYALPLSGSLFFNRNETKDRLALSKKLSAHINRRPQICPLIIFPEGTCVNNEATVLFQKGAFELDCLICPVAIKYNKKWLDPYWNTRQQSFSQHLFYLMTRWWMIVDVWWLPPQRIRKGESSIEFANRVKSMISESAGLKNLSWNGYMKNCMRKKDQDRMKDVTQQKYVSYLRRRITPPHTDSPSSHLSEGSENISSPLPIHIPTWLSDASIVEIQNELLKANEGFSEPDPDYEKIKFDFSSQGNGKHGGGPANQ